FAVQNHADSPGALREALIETLSRVPEGGVSRAIQSESEFVFLLVESVPLSTGVIAPTARELVHALVAADASVWFYHLIEAPWVSDCLAVVEALRDRAA